MVCPWWVTYVICCAIYQSKDDNTAIHSHTLSVILPVTGSNEINNHISTCKYTHKHTHTHTHTHQSVRNWYVYIILEHGRVTYLYSQ